MKSIKLLETLIQTTNPNIHYPSQEQLQLDILAEKKALMYKSTGSMSTTTVASASQVGLILNKEKEKEKEQEEIDNSHVITIDPDNPSIVVSKIDLPNTNSSTGLIGSLNLSNEIPPPNHHLHLPHISLHHNHHNINNNEINNIGYALLDVPPDEDEPPLMYPLFLLFLVRHLFFDCTSI